MRDELAGFTIGVTADRRRDELAALLQRRGARVVLAPALRIVRWPTTPTCVRPPGPAWNTRRTC